MQWPSACRRLASCVVPRSNLFVLPASAPSSSTRAQRRSLSSAGSDDDRGRRCLWRWGSTAASKLSKQDVVEVSANPTLVEGVKGATGVACGAGHSAFVVDGKLFNFGTNKYHQLGRETAGDSSSGTGAEVGEVSFEAPDGSTPRVVIAACGHFHSAAITEDGGLWTWGWGGSFWGGAGALGHSGRSGATKPVLVERFSDEGEMIRQVACGAQHTIVLTNEGRLYSTGKGDFGILGLGDSQDKPEFEEIEYFHQSVDSVLAPTEPAMIVKVAAGHNFSAALSQQGEVWVWGRNDYGQLGLGEEAMGDMYSAERYPRLVRSLPIEGHRIVDMACGEHHVVVLTAGGAIYEWGNRTWLEPVPVSLPARYEEGLKNIVKVGAGDKFSFALTAEGQLYSWGAKSSGCLALGSDCDKNVVEPTLVSPELFGHQKIVGFAASKWRCMAITQEDEHVA